MVDRRILANTRSFYVRRADDDDRYVFPSEVLSSAVRRLGLTEQSRDNQIKNSEQFVVVRSRGALGKAELVRHPLDLVEIGILAGIERLEAHGEVDGTHTCLIAVPRGSLTVTFTCIYEVVRRCGWSVLPLGGSSDGHDIAELCRAFEVDTLVLASDAIDSVFSEDLVGRFNGLRWLLHVSGLPSRRTLNVLASGFPQLGVQPFLYISDVTGPIGKPALCRGGDTFDMLDHVLVEVETNEGEIVLNGSGAILVSVLGLEEPTLVRRRIGDVGVLKTIEGGRQVVEIRRQSPR
jgi:hypothetical protein